MRAFWLIPAILFAVLEVAFAQLPWQPGVVTPATSGGSFTGIGDVSATGIIAHGGSIAFKSSTRGTNMLRICDNITGGAGTCKNVATDATTGLVSSTQTVGSIGACGTGGNQCYVDTTFDDSGANACTGSAPCDAPLVGSLRPMFVPNGVGTIPTTRCSIAGAAFETTLSVASAPVPNTFIASVSIPATPPPTGYYLGYGSGVGARLANDGATSGKVFIYAGSIMYSSAALAANTFTALIGVIPASGNGTIDINGTTTSTGSAGTSASSGKISICNLAAAVTTDMDILEWAVYGSDQVANLAALTSALQTNGGY